MKLVGTLKGHKRGVWCVEFSNVDQVLVRRFFASFLLFQFISNMPFIKLTSSADKTIKLWSVRDFSCLRVLRCLSLSLVALIVPLLDF